MKLEFEMVQLQNVVCQVHINAILCTDALTVRMQHYSLQQKIAMCYVDH